MAEAAADDPAMPGDDPKAVEGLPATKKQRRGIVSRIWRAVFGGRGDDYEKKLQNLSKEEASVLARMKRRALSSRKMARNLIIFSVIVEVVAVAYAIMTTRSLELNWQMRAVRVLPMFMLPALSSVIYSTLLGFTRMLDRKDQKTLERLRAERKAKIDELKERTNYYSTQQLIQRYDLDPAAKAAAAAVLASKLGADSGLKLHLGDESKTQAPSAKSNDVELVQSGGLRNRRQSHARSNSTGTSVIPQVTDETSGKSGADSQGTAAHSLKVVEHYRGTGRNDGGWIARIAALLVGEDPSQSYALICGNCYMHNGLARREEFPYITYYCPHCHVLNQPRQSGGPESGSPAVCDGNYSRNVSNASSAASSEVMENKESVQDLPSGAE